LHQVGISLKDDELSVWRPFC